MICDFKTVTNILFKNISSVSNFYYVNILNILFGSYLLENKIYNCNRRQHEIPQKKKGCVNIVVTQPSN